MLHVILFILKLIGILLLVLLGLLLLVLLVVLLVPVRYRADGELDKKPDVTAGITWLFHLISVRASYKGELRVKGRVLWFRLLDVRLWPPEEDEPEPEPDVRLEPERAVPSVPAPSMESRKLEPADIVNSVLQEADDGEELLVHSMELGEPERSEPEPRHSEEYGKTPTGQEQTGQPPKLEPEPKMAEETRPNIEPKSDLEAGPNTEPKAESKPESDVSDVSAVGKFFQKLAAFFKKIFLTVKGAVQGVFRSVQSLKKGIRSAMDFWEDSENRETISLVLTQSKKILRHLLPRKIKGRIRFGFEDPYYTGQILSAVSPFYALYARSLTLEPVFDEAVLEGEIHLKGRIRIISLLWIGFQLLRNKKFRKLLKKWMR